MFFEAAMRHLNFTEAAEELFVTQAAVSKRVRQLEDWLGVDLFERAGRRLQPTEAGIFLADKAGMTLDFLDQALRTLKVPERPVVRVASVTALAAFWLQPKLKDFALSEEACLFNLITADDPGDLLRPEHDLAILHGDGRLPGWMSVQLFQEILVPVGAPDVIEAMQTDGERRGPPLLDYPRLAPNWIDWEGWILRTGRDEFRGFPVQLCATYNQSIGRALNGQGLALGALPLLQEEIASGRLVPLEGAAFATGKGYYISWPGFRPISWEAERLKAALLAAGAHAETIT